MGLNGSIPKIIENIKLQEISKINKSEVLQAQKQQKNMNYSLNVLVEILISFSGFLLISSGPERNRFYSSERSYIMDNSYRSSQLLLLALSLSMMLILFVSSTWLKILCITAFLYYDFLCYDILTNLGSFSGLLVFVQNYFIAWLAIEGCMTASDQRAKEELKKSKLQTQENYQAEGWYPLELPVEENDVESSEYEVERIKQLVRLPSEQVIKLEEKIEQNIEKEETKIKNMREKQLELHFKLIMKVLEMSNSATANLSLPISGVNPQIKDGQIKQEDSSSKGKTS